MSTLNMFKYRCLLQKLLNYEEFRKTHLFNCQNNMNMAGIEDYHEIISPEKVLTSDTVNLAEVVELIFFTKNLT